MIPILNFSNILFNRIESVLAPSANLLKALHRLKIYNIRDLLFYLPRAYLIKKINPDLSKLSQGELIQAEVYIEEIKLGKGRTPTKILVKNQTGCILLLFFNPIPSFIFNRLLIGSKHTVSGKVQFFEHYFQINHPEFIIKKELENALEPVYSLTYGMTGKQLYYYICKSFELLNEKNNDVILDNLKILHLFKFKDDCGKIFRLWEEARKNLAKLELLANQASLKMMRNNRSFLKPYSFPKSQELQNSILNKLGFELTSGQHEVLKEIEQDQMSNSQMMRLLQGDVGSGKTLVALLSIVNVVVLGFQAVLMAPTDLLANQHYEFFKKALADNADFSIGLLTGKTTQKERKELLQRLELGENKILIGTHALFQEKITFKNLAYVVIDEQHKFGVEQRLKLINKGAHPDVLVMTATPIPRSLSLTMFGDMEISSLKHKPKGRLKIITTVVSKFKIEEVVNSLQRKISVGEKIYWVCPLIEATENEDNILQNVIDRFEDLKRLYQDMVGLIHGKMAQTEKNLVMENFKSGHIQILVATTVIEVGIDVPNATLTVIENAEQFGLAQLHQLRGRVGRSDLQSYCILIYNPKKLSNLGKKRLEVMKSSDDGFYIAEQDLILRGSGELLGSKQSGEPEFYFADLKSDLELLLNAKKIADRSEISDELSFYIKIFSKNLHFFTATSIQA